MSNLRCPALAPIVAKWKKKLKLRDYRISAQWVTQTELEAFFLEDADETPEGAKKIATLACASTEASHRQQYNSACLENRSVRILLKIGAFDSPEDIEQSLLHEMLHIFFWPIAPNLDKDDLGRIHLEQIILTLEKLLTEG